MSVMIKGLHRNIQPGSSITDKDHSPANQHINKPRKTNIQVKVALIGAVSVIVAAIITAILGPAFINRITISSPTPVYIVGPSHGTINSTPPNTGENTSNSTRIQGNRNSTHVQGNGNSTHIQGNGNSTNIQGNGNSTNIQGNDNSINSGP